MGKSRGESRRSLTLLAPLSFVSSLTVDGSSGEVFSSGYAPAPTHPSELDRPSVPRPMVLVALAYIAGLSLGRWMLLPVWSLLGPAILIPAWVGLGLYRTRGDSFNLPHSGLLILIALGLIGWASSNHAIRIDAEAEAVAGQFASYALTRVEGTIAEQPSIGHNSVRLVLNHVTLASAPAGPGAVAMPLKVLVIIYEDPFGTDVLEDATFPVQGSKVRVWGRITQPKAKIHPWAFDRVHYLRGRGIGAELRVRSVHDIEALGGQKGWRLTFFGMIGGLREAMRSNLRAALEPRRVVMAEALLLGERRKLSDETYEAFVRTGLAHILSVSGLHTGFVLLLALIIARAVLPPRRWAIAAISVLWIYAALTGFRPPVFRASLMGTFFLSAGVLGRTTSSVAALATAAFFTLLIDPRNLLRVDWQLSYVCVLSIVLFGPVIYRIFPESEPQAPEEADSRPVATSLLRWLRKWIWLPVSIVVAVQIGLLALNTLYFHQISLITIPATLLALPAAFGIVAGSITVALLGWIAPLSWIIGPILGALIGAFEWIVNFFSSFPGVLLILPSMAPWLMGLYYGVLLIGPHLRGTEDRSGDISPRQKSHMFWRLAFAFVVIIWLPILGSYDSRGFLDLYVVDVGQGDSIVLRFPDGKIGVIDGGAVNSLQGRRTVAPFLRWLGTERIDFMIATHGDADHVGGLVYLLENFEVGLFIHGPDRSDTDVFQELHRVLEEKGINVREVRAGDTLEGFGAIEVTFLNPAPGDDGNDASVVVLLDYGEVEILLTGDIEAGAERSILDRKLAEDIDVLKIAHHGSRTSTTARFLDAFVPEIALISAGRNNQYGHPAPEVLERLSERNIAVARTDRLGTLQVRTDGRRLALYHHGD